MVEILCEYNEKRGTFIIKMKILKVKTDDEFPEGIKYSLVALNNQSKKRVVGFDNHYGKGHHYHVFNREFSYDFVDEWQVITDFEKEVLKVQLRL